MRIQVIKSFVRQVSRFSGRRICFLFIIASVFHFGQSFSTDSTSVYPYARTSAKNDELQKTAATKSNNGAEITAVTGEEHIYIAEGISFYGIDEKSVNNITKRKTSVPQPQKPIAKKESARKKATANKPVVKTQSITSLPERNTQHYIPLSGQAIGVAPGTAAYHFILYQYTEYIVQGNTDEYIIQNYHYLFSSYSKNKRSGSGIRPPPFSG